MLLSKFVNLSGLITLLRLKRFEKHNLIKTVFILEIYQHDSIEYSGNVFYKDGQNCFVNVRPELIKNVFSK